MLTQRFVGEVQSVVNPELDQSTQAAAPAPGVRIDHFRDSDRNAVAALLGRDPRTPEEYHNLFEHWWDRNPYAPPDWPRGCVMRSPAGGVVGVHCWVPLPYSINGDRRIACSGSHWWVEPEYRSLSFPMLLKFKGAPGSFLICASAVPTVAELLRALHFHRRLPYEHTARYGRTLRYASLAEIVAGRCRLPAGFGTLAARVATPLVFPLDLWAARQAAPYPADLHCEVLNRIEPGFDRLWEQLQARYRAVLVRDTTAMNWLLFDPTVALRRMVIGCRDGGGRLIGYAVFRITHRPPVSRLRAELREMYCDEARPDAYDALIHASVAEAARRGYWRIEFQPSSDEQLRHLQYAALERRTSMAHIFLFSRPRDRAGFNPEDFYFTLLDGDEGYS